VPVLNGEPVEIAPGRGDLRFSSTPPGFWSPGGGTSVSLVGGKVVSYAYLFATQTWIAAAVMRMLTWSVRVPLKVYRQTGDDSRERAIDTPLAKAIGSPWDRGSTIELVMALLGPLLVHGNGLVRVLDGAGGQLRFDPLDWRAAQPISPFSKWISGWDVVEDGQTETLSADQALHAAWWSPLGPVGISPLQQLGVTIAIEEAAQRYQRSYLEKGAAPPSALYLPKEVYADEQVRGNIRTAMTARHGGPDQAGNVAILPNDTKWDSVGHTAHEAELIDQRRLTREEVAGVYQIPPTMLGILDKANYATLAAQREMAYTDALGPPLVLIEELVNAQLVRGLLRDQEQYVEFDFGKVLRGDRLKEIQAFREGISSAIYTPNEARRALNLPASPNQAADELYLPTNNLAPLGEVPPLGDPFAPDHEEQT
jgi:HK97 family phage portal protein